MQVNISEARKRLSQLIKVAQAGQTVVIANRGQPVAQLTAVHASPVRAPCGEVGRWLQTTPLSVHARRTGEEIDADMARQRGAWD